MSLFKKLKVLEAQIDGFLDNVDKGALHFTEIIKEYLNGDFPELENRLKAVSELEHQADEMRRKVRFQLYSEMLIPESRGDVLGLLENTDNILDKIKQVSFQIDIERPNIPDCLKDDYLRLAQASSNAVHALVKADIAFFKDNKLTTNYINKVDFYESEADNLGLVIFKKIYQSGVIDDLARKNHLKYFAESIASISDEAQEVCERLSVSAIKREI
ncbi:MAG: DUF47 family protein [Pseudomonadota bacterium]